MSDNGHITWTNVKRKLSDLIPWPRNPRQIKGDQAKRLVQSFDQFGQVETIAIGPGNEVYNGHQRLNVLAQQYGKGYEVECRVASRALEEKEREKLTVFLHKGAAGEWDFDTLANEFELDDLLEWGFEKKELDLDLWLPEPPEDPGAQMDKAEELRQKWGVESGQLWQLGEHRLICGDCTDPATVARVMDGERANLLWTDPPYHVGKEFEGGFDEGVIWDEEFQQAWQISALPFVDGDKQRYVCFAQAQSIHAILSYIPNRLLVWCKPFALMRSNSWDWAYEFIAWCYDGDAPQYFDKPNGTLSFDWQNIASVIHGQEGKWHITQKPIAIPELHIRASCPIGGIVLDPFLGSGTTLIACERLGRKCRAVEISPGYCAVAIQRWVDMTGKEPLLLTEINNDVKPEPV